MVTLKIPVCGGCVEVVIDGRRVSMKRLVSVFTVAMLWLAVPALAVPSLGWWNEGDPGTTHQLWDFTPGHIKVSGHGYTATPESVFNPYPNRVAATIHYGTWDNVTNIVSSTGIDVDLEIPNYEILNDYKEIWVDVGSAVVDQDSITISATDGGSTTFEYTVLPGQGDAEFGVIIWPNPYVEKIDFTVIPTVGGQAVLDYIHVDTICIPEPATVCLLGLGALGLIRRKR